MDKTAQPSLLIEAERVLSRVWLDYSLNQQEKEIAIKIYYDKIRIKEW